MDTVRCRQPGVALKIAPAAGPLPLMGLPSPRSAFVQVKVDIATARVDAVLAQVENAKAAAQEAAETARKAGATFALVGALSLVIGAFIASAAAALGGRQRDDDETLYVNERR